MMQSPLLAFLMATTVFLQITIITSVKQLHRPLLSDQSRIDAMDQFRMFLLLLHQLLDYLIIYLLIYVLDFIKFIFIYQQYYCQSLVFHYIWLFSVCLNKLLPILILSACLHMIISKCLTSVFFWYHVCDWVAITDHLGGAITDHFGSCANYISCTCTCSMLTLHVCNVCFHMQRFVKEYSQIFGVERWFYDRTSDRYPIEIKFEYWFKSAN